MKITGVKKLEEICKEPAFKEGYEKAKEWMTP